MCADILLYILAPAITISCNNERQSLVVIVRFSLTSSAFMFLRAAAAALTPSGLERLLAKGRGE